MPATQSKPRVSTSGGDDDGSTKKRDPSQFPAAVLQIEQVRSHFTRNACCNKNCFGNVLCMPVCQLSLSTTPSIVHSIRRDSSGTVSSERIQGRRDTGSKEDADTMEAQNNFERALLVCRSHTNRLRNSDDSDCVSRFLVDQLEAKKDTTSGKWVYDVLINGHNVEVCRNAYMGMYGYKIDEIKYAQKLINSGASGKTHDMTGEKEWNKKQAFREFGLDYDDLHRHINNFVDYSAVTDKPR